MGEGRNDGGGQGWFNEVGSTRVVGKVDRMAKLDSFGETMLAVISARMVVGDGGGRGWFS